MIQIPTFEIGDKIRQLDGVYELSCSNCDYRGDLADEEGDPDETLVVMEICSNATDLVCP